MENYIFLTLMGNIPSIFYLSIWIVSCYVYMFYKQTIQFNNHSLFKRNLKYLTDVTKFIFLIIYEFLNW